MNKKKTTLRALLEKGQVLAPCIYDNISARAVELAGFPVAVLSGGALAYSMCGVPDMGLLNAEELIWITNRLTDYSPLPIIVDADNGYGDSPLNAYLTALRLAKSGAMAVTIDDSTGIRGFERLIGDPATPHAVVSKGEFLAKIKAALEACKNTDCMVIARSEAMLVPGLGLEEAIDRCVEARALGAEITMVIGLKTLEQGKQVARRDTGWKMWPDIGVTDGRADVEPAEIAKLNFKIVSMHYTEKGALYGMLYYGKKTREDQNTVFHDTHDFDGLLKPGEDYHVLFSFWKKWLPMEAGFNDVSDVMAKKYDIHYDL